MISFSRKSTPRGGILDLDIENRPLSYWYDGNPTAEITAIAAGWDSKPSTIRVWLLGRDTMEEMLNGIVEMYEAASVVTGHYLRVHDLPIISGALIEAGMPKLSQKMVSDTKQDLVRKGQIPGTQEHLADLMGLKEKKLHVTQSQWREANRLTPEGLVLTEKRVVNDVRQHMQLRLALLQAGLLRGPRVWRP